jgi:hypothetical protein
MTEELRGLVSFDMPEDSNRRDQERPPQIPETSKIRNSLAKHVATADGAIDDFDLALFRKSLSFHVGPLQLAPWRLTSFPLRLRVQIIPTHHAHNNLLI